jgi:predicted RNA-binding protein YlxR (DUF448 family)
VTGTSMRTCVGCRARAPRASLLRFVSADGGGLTLDPGRELPGRGAWLHCDPACWGAFVGRRGPVRSLRASPTRAAREALRATLATRQVEEAPC